MRALCTIPANMTTTGKRGVKLMNERQPVIKLSKLQKHEKWSLIIFYFCEFLL